MIESDTEIQNRNTKQIYSRCLYRVLKLLSIPKEVKLIYGEAGVFDISIKINKKEAYGGGNNRKVDMSD